MSRPRWIDNRAVWHARPCEILGLALALAASGPAVAADGALQILQAWVPATEQPGGDLPLLMTIKNDSASPDALLRVRCPFANFSERHTVDRGEGAPAKRAIPSIPIPAGGTFELKPDGYHVMLLQTRQKLAQGDTLTCSVTFQKAGLLETEVHVKKAD
jgi:copper(I)-binding protein